MENIYSLSSESPYHISFGVRCICSRRTVHVLASTDPAKISGYWPISRRGPAIRRSWHASFWRSKDRQN
ncbi:hypothetical protein KC19_2G109100 [Ceratodon purpureus]|uniref:Uncharacterized protein n=1 Tax=Ceratodon purpureus TaxID=3225 RepID=A0A8T0IU66_CERPU|nr:hypothetical protein KC19_2G109100 [Ceratodon purpureus]